MAFDLGSLGNRCREKFEVMRWADLKQGPGSTEGLASGGKKL